MARTAVERDQDKAGDVVGRSADPLPFFDTSVRVEFDGCEPQCASNQTSRFRTSQPPFAGCGFLGKRDGDRLRDLAIYISVVERRSQGLKFSPSRADLDRPPTF